MATSSSTSSSASPCGACKFLRRKCLRGCVFAPYFSHEQGLAQFGAIHKVFGASNVAKILTRLPISHRAEATITISYEAQARLQDPIYGCVSQIFALQQQVVNLEAHLAYLKETICSATNPNLKQYGQLFPCLLPQQDLQNWSSNLQPYENFLNTADTNFACNNTSNGTLMVSEENCNVSSSSYHGEWSSNDLHSIAFGYSMKPS